MLMWGNIENYMLTFLIFSIDNAIEIVLIIFLIAKPGHEQKGSNMQEDW